MSITSTWAGRVLSSGCTRARMTRFTAPLEPKPDSAEVPFLTTLPEVTDPNREYKAVGELHVWSTDTEAGHGRRMAKLKEMAREMGADALIQSDIGDQRQHLAAKAIHWRD
jgi:hypothetical protein